MLYLVDWLFPGHCYLHPGPRSVLGLVLLIPWWDEAGLGSVPGFKFVPHCILYQLSAVTSVALCFTPPLQCLHAVIPSQFMSLKTAIHNFAYTSNSQDLPDFACM